MWRLFLKEELALREGKSFLKEYPLNENGVKYLFAITICLEAVSFPNKSSKFSTQSVKVCNKYLFP